MKDHKNPTLLSDRRRFLKGLALGAAAAPFLTLSGRLIAGREEAAADLCTVGPVLNPATDLKYQGVFRLFQADDTNTFLGFSNGAITGRVVNGNIRLFVAGTWPGKDDPIYEVEYPGVGATVDQSPRAALVKNWGNIYGNRRLINRESPQTHLRGLLWADDMLVWSYGDNYAAGGYHNPSIGATILNADGSSVAYGPWRTTAHSQMTRGYMVRNPRTGQIGYGAPITSGNSESAFGACLHMGSKPNPGRAADPVLSTQRSLETSAFIDHSINRKQRRFDTNYKICGWNVQYDASKGGWTEPGHDSFDTMDAVTAAAWVETPRRSGIVCFGQLIQTIPGFVYGGGDTVTHRWYGPQTCIHGQDGSALQAGIGDSGGTAVLNAWVFNPDNPSADPPPVPLRTFSPLNRAMSHYHLGGAWFEPSSQLLFVSQNGSDTWNQYMAQPVIHVFKVD